MASTVPWQPSDKTNRNEIAALNYGGDLHVYALGFREGAEQLLEFVKAKRHSHDLLVYPIVYNLRHSVELLLKQVIRAARRLLDDEGDFPDSHRLIDLWHTCKPLLRRIWPSDDSLSIVETAVLQLAEIDPEGESFRYPVSAKRGGARTNTLRDDLRVLDLGALFDEVTRAIELLEGADTGIDVYLSSQAGMREEARQIEREMRAEMEADLRAEYEGEY